MTLVETTIEKLGFGGDLRPVLLVYLAATTRVLGFRRGRSSPTSS